MKQIKKWGSTFLGWLIAEVPACIFYAERIKGEAMSLKEIVLVGFLILCPLLVAFLIYRMWVMWEQNQVLMRKVNALQKLQEFEVGMLGEIMEITQMANLNIVKDGLNAYRLNVNPEFKMEGMQQIITNLIKMHLEGKKQQRNVLINAFQDNEYH